MAGMDPYEERLLIILLGGGFGLLALLTLLFVCCRKYRVDRKAASGGVGRLQSQPQAWNTGQARVIYQPTGFNPGGGLPGMMEPGMLDPGKACLQSGAYKSYQPQVQIKQPLLVSDNSDTV